MTGLFPGWYARVNFPGVFLQALKKYGILLGFFLFSSLSSFSRVFVSAPLAALYTLWVRRSRANADIG